MKRRKFIVLATAGTAILSFPLACTEAIPYDPILAQPQTLSAIMEGSDISKIGVAYLEKYSNENTSNKLVKQLRKKLPIGSENLSDALALRIQDDFKKERTVIIDGWVLSRTEARQSALFSLTQPN